MKMLEYIDQNQPLQTEIVEKFIVIGSCEMKTTDFIDINKTAQDKCIILEGMESPFTFLVLNSLFVPSNVTRIEYQLMSD